MIKLFIVIVIAAEVVLTVQIVSLILKIDKKVCALNERIMALTPVIKEKFSAIRIVLDKVLLELNNFGQKLSSKKEKYKFLILKNLVTIALFLVMNTDFKKILSAVDLAISVKDFMKEWTKKLA